MSLAACCLVHGICCQWLVLCPTLLLIKELLMYWYHIIQCVNVFVHTLLKHCSANKP